MESVGMQKQSVILTEEKDIKQYEWSKMLDKMGFFKFTDNLQKETAEKFCQFLKDKLLDYYNVITKKDVDEILIMFTEEKK